MTMSEDENQYTVQVKTRKRTGKDLRHSDLGHSVVQIVITAQTTNVLGTILNSLVTETRDYRSTHARILLEQIVAGLEPCCAPELEMYLTAAKTTIKTHGARP